MSKNKIFWISIVAWGLGLAISIVGTSIFYSFVTKHEINELLKIRINLWQLPIVIIPGIIVYRIMNKMYRKHEYQTIYFFPPIRSKLETTPFKNQKTTLLAGFIISTITVVIVGVVMQLVKGADSEVSFVHFVLFGGSINSTIYMLAPAISEELFIRAGFLHAFLIRGNRKTGIIITSSFFGLLHIFSILLNNSGFGLENILWILNLMVVGGFLAFIYIQFGVLCAIFLHWFWNASFQGSAMHQVEGNIIAPIILIIILVMVKLISKRSGRGSIQLGATPDMDVRRDRDSGPK